MMLGKPVIVAENTHMDQLVGETHAGLIVRYGDVTDLESALQSLAENLDLGLALGAAGRGAYDNQYSWSKMETRIINLYTMVSD